MLLLLFAQSVSVSLATDGNLASTCRVLNHPWGVRQSIGVYLPADPTAADLAHAGRPERSEEGERTDGGS